MLHPVGKIGIFVVSATLLAMGQTPAAKSATRRPAVAKSADAVPANSPRPIPQMWPEQLPAQAPRVTYQNGLLTVDSQNSTLGDILTAIRRQTGAELELPPGIGSERVAAHLSGPARDVITSLLDGSSVGYIILGSADNPGEVRKVILSILPKDAGTPPPSTAQAKPPAPEPVDEDQPDPVEPTVPPPARVIPPPSAAVPPGQPGQPPPNAGMGMNPNPGGPSSDATTQRPPSQTEDSATPKTPEQYLQQLRGMHPPQQSPAQPQQ
jgi:hypothetical protein